MFSECIRFLWTFIDFSQPHQSSNNATATAAGSKTDEELRKAFVKYKIGGELKECLDHVKTILSPKNKDLVFD